MSASKRAAAQIPGCYDEKPDASGYTFNAERAAALNAVTILTMKNKFMEG